MKTHPAHTQGRARRKHGGDQGHPEEAERRKRKGTETAGSKEEDLGMKRPRSDTIGVGKMQ